MKRKLFMICAAMFLLFGGEAAQQSATAQNMSERWGSADIWSGTPGATELSEAVNCGFGWFEADISGLYTSPSALAQLKKDCEAAGIKLWSAHLPYGGSHDVSVLDDEIRKQTLEKFKTAIKNASEQLGVERLILHSSYEPISDSERPQRVAKAKESIAELQHYADGFGVTLCVEDLPRTCLGNTPEELMQLIEGTNAGICFDTNHYSQGTMEHFIDVAGSKIATVHFSDFEFAGECHWLPGQGKIAWGELIHLLEEAGYKGVYMSEALKDHANDDTPITIQQLAESYKQIFAEYEALCDPKARLDAKVEEIKNFYFPGELTLTDVFAPGTDPGFYSQDAVTRFSGLYEAASAATDNYDQKRKELTDALNELLGSSIPLTPGYYWIQTAADYFLAKDEPVNMAMYSDNTALLKWKKFEPALQFLFKVETWQDGFSIQNMYDDSYIGANAVNSQPIPMISEPEYVQYATAYGTYGQMALYNSLNSQRYHMLGHGSGSGTGSNIVQYNSVGVRSASAWYLRRVDDETVKQLLDAKIPVFTDEVKRIVESPETYVNTVYGYPQEAISTLTDAYTAWQTNHDAEALRTVYNAAKKKQIQPTAGQVYRIKSFNRGTFMASSSGNLGIGCALADGTDEGCYWMLKAGEQEGEWILKNLKRDANLGIIGKTSESVVFATASPGIYRIEPTEKGLNTVFFFNDNTTNPYVDDNLLHTQGSNLLAWKSSSEGSKWYMQPVADSELEDLYLNLATRLCQATAQDGWPGMYDAASMKPLRSAYAEYADNASDETARQAVVEACAELVRGSERNYTWEPDRYYRLVNGAGLPLALTVTTDAEGVYTVSAAQAGNLEEGVTDVDMLWTCQETDVAGQFTLRSANGLYLQAHTGSGLPAGPDEEDAAPYRMAQTEQGDWWIQNFGGKALNASKEGPVTANDAGEGARWRVEPVDGVQVIIGTGGYSTRNFPFAVDLTDAQAQGLKAYTVTQIQNEKVILSEFKGHVVATGTPLVLQADEGEAFILPMTGEEGVQPTGNELKGTLAAQAITEPAYVLATQDSQTGFYRLSASDNVVPANRAYLTALPGSSVTSFGLDFAKPTGIESVTVGAEGEDVYYTLDGIRVKTPQNGIYVNGKGQKVLIRKK